MTFAIKKKLDFVRAWIKSMGGETKIHSVSETLMEMSHGDFVLFCRLHATRQTKSHQELETPKKVAFVEPVDEEKVTELPPAGVKLRRSSLPRACASLGGENPNVNPRRGSEGKIPVTSRVSGNPEDPDGDDSDSSSESSEYPDPGIPPRPPKKISSKTPKHT